MSIQRKYKTEIQFQNDYEKTSFFKLLKALLVFAVKTMFAI